MDRLSIEAFSSLVSHLYAAAYDGSTWPKALGELQRTFNGSRACLGIENDRTQSGKVVCINNDPYYIDLYLRELMPHNVLWRPLRPTAAGSVVTDQSFLSKADFRKSLFFNEFFAPLRDHGVLSCKILSGEHVQGVISLHRADSQPDFDAHDVRLMQLLAPTLTQVALLGERMGALDLARDGNAAALDKLTLGTFVVDADGRIIRANAAAHELLSARDCPLLMSRDRLTARRAEHARTLARLMARSCAWTTAPAAQADAAGGYMLLSPATPAGSTLSIYVGPLVAPEAYGLTAGASAIVFVKPVQNDPSLKAQARKLFGLTEAEAVTAAAICAGMSLTQAAALQRVRQSTVRTHLVRIYQKTGTHQQSQMVALLKAIALPVRTD